MTVLYQIFDRNDIDRSNLKQPLETFVFFCPSKNKNWVVIYLIVFSVTYMNDEFNRWSLEIV